MSAPATAPIDFIVIGAQKAGTTALYEHLADHPQIGLSDVKETHFFDDEGQDWAAPDYAAYHARFPAPRAGAVRGEATPIYVYWPGCLERIARYHSGVRLILMLRDPVERAFSNWRMEYARGVETEPFAWCIRQGRQRLFAAEPWGRHREFSYVERGFYGEQVERLFSLFAREQVLIERAEDLQADPAAVLARICGFLGIAPPEGPVAPRRVHVGAKLDYPSTLTDEDRTFLQRLYARDMARLQALTGLSFW